MINSVKSDMDQLDEELEYLGADWKATEHKLLAFYVKVMPKLMDVERCSIFISERDPDNNKIWLRAGTGIEERAIEVDTFEDSVVSEAIRSGEVVYKTDLEKENGFHKEVDAAVGFVTHDILCMPISSIDGKHTTGAVQLLNRKDAAPYSEQDLELLREMLHYLELSIENIYFEQQSTGLMHRLYRLLRLTSIGAVLMFFAIVVAFTLYWFGFFLF